MKSYKGVPNKMVPVKANSTTGDMEIPSKKVKKLLVSDTYVLGDGGELTISGSFISESCEFYPAQRPGGATGLSISSIDAGSVTVAGTNAGTDEFSLLILG